MNQRPDSKEFVYSSFTTNHDTTGDQVEVALPATGQAPVAGDWHVAEVVGVTDLGTGSWKTTYRLMVGPGGDVTLPVGSYDWTVRITDTPEIPVRKAGTLVIAL